MSIPIEPAQPKALFVYVKDGLKAIQQTLLFVRAKLVVSFLTAKGFCYFLYILFEDRLEREFSGKGTGLNR